ncbi:MAG: hypothetical protein HC896_00915 [Bacteroidales bacterium]|nr:hypothetical protein [Bacteroidales bacterium]
MTLRNTNIAAVVLCTAAILASCKKDDNNNNFNYYDLDNIDNYLSVEEKLYIAQAFPLQTTDTTKALYEIKDVVAKQSIADFNQPVSFKIITDNQGKPFVNLYLGVHGVNGFYSIPPSSFSVEKDSIVTFDLRFVDSTNIKPYFFLKFALRSEDGVIAVADSIKIIKVDGVLGEMTVTMSWGDSNYADLDLFVFEPGANGQAGDTVYQGKGQSTNGGRLLKDSNRSCNIDSLNTEVIEYDLFSAIQVGTYSVKALLADTCQGHLPINLNLFARLNGDTLFYEYIEIKEGTNFNELLPLREFKVENGMAKSAGLLGRVIIQPAKPQNK